MNNYLRSELFSDEAVMESLTEMRMAQPTKDRMNYFNIVLEGSTETNADLIQKLYVDIISKSNIDFGSIPDSRGVLTKYKEYPLMCDAMDNINKLFRGVSCEDVDLMNQMHDMICQCKKDYEMGFTYNIEIIKVIYNTSVVTLYELINMSILAYTKQMRADAKIHMDFNKSKKKNNIVRSNAKSLIKSYQRGQWNKMISALKKDKTLFNGVSPATEADTKLSFGEGVKKVGEFIQKYPALTIPIIVVTSIAIILFSIRKLIYFFYSGSVSVKSYVETQKEFVDTAIRNEKEEGESENVIKKHSKLADKLQSIANFIEVKILRTNQKAMDEIQKSNVENFHTPNPDQASFGGGAISF